ncbi:hypothetical protein Csa_023648 [Cucumis sativus]|nr:hypothetical protein Csa_023648 [Cucumis sativus]
MAFYLGGSWWGCGKQQPFDEDENAKASRVLCGFFFHGIRKPSMCESYVPSLGDGKLIPLHLFVTTD